MPLENNTPCYHCGEPCPDLSIMVAEKPFCCEGCKMVYQILEEGDLCQYYDLEQNPGISLKSKPAQTRFEYLDDPEVRSKLIRFAEGDITVVKLHVPQIHCASCLWLLENLYKLRDGIISAQVNFVQKDVTIRFNESVITLRQLIELLSSIGYEPSLSLESLGGNSTQKVNRRLYYQLGVSGFAFGNIMLLSFPEYLGMEAATDWTHSAFFGYLSILLVLPVFLYSSQDYFKSAWHGLRKGYLNIDVPVSLGILVLFGWSCFEIISGYGAGYMDSLAGLVFFLLIGKWYQSKTYDRLSFERDYSSYFPIAITKFEDGKELSVPLTKLQIGDTILVRNQELIPADGLLTAGDARIDYSFVTGESVPVRKQTGDEVFAGGKQVGSSIKLTLTKQVSQSYLTELWSQQAFQKAEDDDLGTIANRVSRYFTPVILALAVGTFLFWSRVDWVVAIQAAAAVLIVACPCALALASPFTFGNAMRLLGRANIYLKDATIVERLAAVTAVVFDKTGTITQAKESSVTYEGQELSPREWSAVKSITKNSLHPLSQQITTLINEPANLPVKDYQEKEGAGIEGYCGDVLVQVGSASFVQAPAVDKALSTRTWIAIDGEVKGYFEFKNQYRSGLEDILDQLSAYQLAVVSGDNASEQKRLAAMFPQGAELHFSQSPQDKLNYIQQLQNNGANVMMLGDGLNDAGALKQSNVGVSISEDVNNFSPACDVIMDADQFSSLAQVLQFSNRSVLVVKWAFVISFMYNAVGLFFAMQGALSPLIAAILMPVSSFTVVAFSTILTWWYGKQLLQNHTDTNSLEIKKSIGNEYKRAGKVA